VDYKYVQSVLDLSARATRITWATLKEWENSHFEIERSLNGAKSFDKIGSMEGRGWTEELTEYVFEDADLPLAGGNIFYRLKQVDLNGKYSYSEIVAVRLPEIYHTKGVWRAYPNPVASGETFRVSLINNSAYRGEALTVRFINSLDPGTPFIFENEEELNLYLSQLPSNGNRGLQIIQLQWGNSVEHIKIIRE
jgi:hypothetical protein